MHLKTIVFPTQNGSITPDWHCPYSTKLFEYNRDWQVKFVKNLTAVKREKKRDSVLSTATQKETDLSEVVEQKLLSNPKCSDFPQSNLQKNNSSTVSLKTYNLPISQAHQT